MTDSEIMKLNLALKAPAMSDAALRAVSAPAASLAAWLWAILHYRLAQRRGLPTGLLLRQVEATRAREQARLAHYQFQAQEILEHNLALIKKLEDVQASHNHLVENLSWAQCDQYHKWPIKAALLTPMHSWTSELQVTSSAWIFSQSLFLHHCLHSSAPLCALTAHLCPTLPSLPCFPPYPALFPLCQTLCLYPSHCPTHPLVFPSTSEVERVLPDSDRRCPPVFSCHHLPGSLPTTEAPGATGQVAGSV